MTVSKQATLRIDVRAISPSDRHSRILAAFEALAPDGELTVVTDHEPRPLRLKLEARYPDHVIFVQRQLGIGHWEVTLRRSVAACGVTELGAFLRRCAVLLDASERTLLALEEHAVERSVRQGTTIVEQDVPWCYLGLVRSGTLASIMSSTSGRDQKLFDILAGETFGIVEAIDGGRTVARIVTTSPTARVVLLPRSIVLNALSEDRTFARALTVMCAQRTRRLAERYTEHLVRPALARVAAAILPYSSLDPGLSPALEPLRRMTQAQLALTAGTAKEVAARAIAELEAAGAIRRARGHIAEIDRSKLDAVIAGR